MINRVLVLKFGALGDVIQGFAAFDQIRSAHPHAQITLLTTPPYAEFAAASGLFDRIETDGRPKGVWPHLRLFRRLRRARFDRVYDLQNSSRSKRYIYGFWPRPPEWSGISAGASHRQTRPDRTALHNLDRAADQLHVAGIGPAVEPGGAPAPDLRWAARIGRRGRVAAADALGLAAPFAILVPGASPVKPEKFWPADRYGALAAALIARGVQVAVVGAGAETPLAKVIQADAPKTVDLTGRTDLFQLAALGEEALLCVGNDTGPTHLLAYAGAPGVMLMSKVTDPSHCAPRAAMGVIKVEDLAELSAARVLDALDAQLGDRLPHQSD
jgi:ADP-heptose:LPS heptosyltransferase